MVLSLDFWEIFQNSFFVEHLWTAAFFVVKSWTVERLQEKLIRRYFNVLLIDLV